jgi:hypothetical protein
MPPLSRCEMIELPSVGAETLSPIPIVSTGEFAEVDTAGLLERYKSADPYPHIVIDGLFPKEVLKAVLGEISDFTVPNEKSFYASVNKRRQSDADRLPPATRRLIEALNSAAFLKFLERVTGVEGLLPDPYLEGGGVHQIGPGGFLKIHTDFNWHEHLSVHRRINILLYLNEEWQDDWNGHLELWDESVSERRQKIAPLFNRMVIFSTTDSSYHGHPEPLACPDGVVRNSIAMYYYTSARPAGETKFGSSTMTNYRERPAELFAGGKAKHLLHQIEIRNPGLRKISRIFRK